MTQTPLGRGLPAVLVLTVILPCFLPGVTQMRGSAPWQPDPAAAFSAQASLGGPRGISACALVRASPRAACATCLRRPGQGAESGQPHQLPGPAALALEPQLETRSPGGPPEPGSLLALKADLGAGSVSVASCENLREEGPVREARLRVWLTRQSLLGAGLGWWVGLLLGRRRRGLIEAARSLALLR